MDSLTPEGRFQHSIKHILEHEGGLSVDERDPGGITKFGISLRFLRTIGIDIDRDGKVDAEDILALSKPGAIDIYRKHWWDKYRYGGINELNVVEKVFDLAVNAGGSRGHKLLQKAVNRIYPGRLVVDGILGAKTFAGTNACDPEKLRKYLRIEAKNFYLSLIKARPTLKVFKNGWLRRAAW